MDKLELVRLLSGREPEGIIRTLAMMAYIPAISRVLEKGGVDKFADLMVETGAYVLRVRHRRAI